MPNKITPLTVAALDALRELITDATYEVTASKAKYIKFTLRGEVAIDGHRTAVIDREISIAVKQKGSLPRRGQFKAKEGKECTTKKS